MSMLFGRENRTWHLGASLMGRGGVNRYFYSGFCGVDGVARQFLAGHIRAGDIAEVRAVPYMVRVFEMEGLSSIGSMLYSKSISTAEDLQDEGIRQYGTVTVDTQRNMITVISNAANSYLEIIMRTEIVMEEPSIYVPATISIQKFERLEFIADWTIRFSGTYNAEGGYGLNAYGLPLHQEYVSGSASGTATLTPETGTLGAVNDISVAAGRIEAGTTTVTMTLKTIDFDDDGKPMTPQIIFKGGN